MTGGRKRRAAEAGILSGSVVAALAIFLLVNWLGSRHWIRGDWTKARIYSLSSVTKKIVGNLKEPVQVTVFMTRDARLYPQIEELLNRYEALSPKVHVEELDPRRNLARAQQLVSEYNVRQNTVVFQSGGKKKYVTEDEIADFNFSGAPGRGSSIKSFKGEQAFTSAIVAVTSHKSPKIYFTAGHGEKSLDDGGEGGLSDVKDVLTKDNDTLATWESLGKSDVPADADLVVVAGPRTAFLAPEAKALDGYLSRGGHLLLLLDPVFPAPAAPPPDLGLGELLKAWGVKLDDDIVVDPGNALPFIGAETVYANHFGSQEIVDPLASAKTAVIFPLARSVAGATASHAGFSAVTLVETTGDGWGETDLTHLSEVRKDGKDVAAPVSLAVAVARGKEVAAKGPGADEAARMVVVGDSDFVANADLRNVANANFFLNAVHWLLGSENEIGIAPKTPEQTTVTLSASQLRRILWLSIAGIPGIAILAGILVWVKRRG
jgi:ABC-type uncharacterized transport system involved in gliding motility auxiliary subunit